MRLINESFSRRKGSRARFHHLSLKNSSAKNEALESITALADSIYFGDEAQPPHPVVYTDTYVEWEANRVRIDRTQPFWTYCFTLFL